jgi:protein-disulfide isomerase
MPAPSSVLIAAFLMLFGSLPAAVAQGHTRAHASTQATRATLAAPAKNFGSPSAPIKLEVFSDYQCPSCRSFYEGTLRPMMSSYVAEGKVYLVHHDFPLQMHAYSGQAARWANAAAEIGKFEDVEAAFFDNQPSWSADGNLEKYVAGAMSASEFKRVQAMMKGCTGPAPTSRGDRSLPQPEPSCPMDTYIIQDIAQGYQIPVQATPTYVISYKGQKYPAGSGAVSWDIMKQFFDSLLSQ